jgi:HAD superfamily hydrolase (TIGR01509 family)
MNLGTKKIEAIIFDMDGTLVDSMHVWEKIDVDFFEKRGIDTPPDYFEAVVAMGIRETADYTIKRFALNETTDEVIREWEDMAAYEYAHNISLKPNVREYLTRLRGKRMKMAIATSSPIELVETALGHNDIRDYFDCICTSDEAGRGKEFPDVFLLAAKKLGVSPENCLVFEDTLAAAKSAKTADMAVWGVYDETGADRWEELMKVSDGFLYDFSEAPLLD